MKEQTIVAAIVFWAVLQAASPGVSLAQVSSSGNARVSSQSASAIALKQDMRKLWTDHVVWTRDYIIAAVDMMKKHLSTTTNEVVARLKKEWDADVRAFDEVYEHILHMSDALADGIVKQFPDKFS